MAISVKICTQYAGDLRMDLVGVNPGREREYYCGVTARCIGMYYYCTCTSSNYHQVVGVTRCDRLIVMSAVTKG